MGCDSRLFAVEGEDGGGSELTPIEESNPFSSISSSSPSSPSSFFFDRDDDAIEASSLSPFRLVSYVALVVALALGSNFLGTTTNLLTLAPEATKNTFRSTGLDQLFPVDGLKKYAYRDSNCAYQFLYPEQWLADQRIEREKAMARELPQSLHEKRAEQLGGVIPQAAFGPARSDGRENISLIKSKVMPGFTLRGTLGTPSDAAEKLLSTVIAPPTSGKRYTLLSAYEDQRNGKPAYVFEYTIQKDTEGGADNRKIPPDFFIHTISVIMTKNGDDLYTLTAIAPESVWVERGPIVKKMADSFELE